MKILVPCFLFILLVSLTQSCKKSGNFVPNNIELYPDPHDSTLLSAFIGYYIYSYPQYKETYYYDNKKRLALVHATQINTFDGTSVRNDSMFLYYSGDDTLVTKIVTRTKATTGANDEKIFVLGYNANRQVIYDTLYHTGYVGNIVVTTKDYNTYTYPSPGVVNAASGSISTGLPSTSNNNYTLAYNSSHDLVKQDLNNSDISKLGYTNVISPYYKMFKLNYGFMPNLAPFGISGFSFGSTTRYSAKMVVNDTSVTIGNPVSTFIRVVNYTTRSDNYPVTFKQFPDITFGPPFFIVNYGNFYYYK